MWCDNCGTKLPEGGAFCPVCGKTSAKKPSAGATGFFSAGSLLEDEPARRPADMAAPVPRPRPVPPVQPTPPVRHEVPVTPARPEAPVAPVSSAPPITRAIPHEGVEFAPITKTTAPKTTAPRTAGEGRRISFARELKLLLRQGWLVMLGEKRNLIFSLLFPVLAAAVTVWVAGKDMFNSMEPTKSACFVLVCAAIWCGLFNSIQVVVKERENIKRDYVSGALRIECYVISRSVLQLLLCFVQSLILVVAIPGVNWQHGKSLPDKGLIISEPLVEFFISLFLVMYASDVLGLLISSIVKKQELASQLAPYILIVQLLFSGVLFKMEGGAEVISALMISRWGMEALGSISNLNDLPLKLVMETKDELKRGQLEVMLEEVREIENAFEAVKDFLKCCRDAGIKTYASIVTGFDEREINVENCEKIAKDLGAEFRNREFITNGY